MLKWMSIKSKERKDSLMIPVGHQQTSPSISSSFSCFQNDNKVARLCQIAHSLTPHLSNLSL